MSLGPGVLVSRGRLALRPPFFALVSLPRLAFARLATPFFRQWVSRSLGFRQSSCPGGSAPSYCIIPLDHGLVRLASVKTRDLISVLPPSYFYSIGHTLPLPHLVFVLWLGYSQHPRPGSVAPASGHLAPHFLLGLMESLGLTRHTF